MRALLLLAAGALAAGALGACQPAPEQRAGTASPDAAREDESDLLLQMLLLQRYAEKAHLAAEADNWPLAAFYAHEVEEAAERLAEGGYAHDELDLGPIARETALPPAERLLAAAEAADAPAFAEAFAGVVAGCNACHARTGHPYLVVQVPDGRAAYPSQRFTP
ncbi:MAG: hypothetical protein ACK41D_00110 [Rubricoccaceae bacterium]